MYEMMGRLMVNKEKFALYISRVLNPVFVLGVVIVLVSFEASGSGTWIVLCVLIALFFTVFAPWLVVLYLRRWGEISELFIPERRDRLRPLFFYFASSWVGVGVLYLIHSPPALYALMVCVAVLGTVALLITMQWKISLHAMGLWAACGVVIALYGSWWAVVPAGLVSWARFVLQAHSVSQILVGSVVGAGVAFLIFGYMLNT